MPAPPAPVPAVGAPVVFVPADVADVAVADAAVVDAAVADVAVADVADVSVVTVPVTDVAVAEVPVADVPPPVTVAVPPPVVRVVPVPEPVVLETMPDVAWVPPDGPASDSGLLHAVPKNRGSVSTARPSVSFELTTNRLTNCFCAPPHTRVHQRATAVRGEARIGNYIVSSALDLRQVLRKSMQKWSRGGQGRKH